jgi:hypothetical protein
MFNYCVSDVCQWQGLWSNAADESDTRNVSDATIVDAGRVEVT